MPDTAWAWGPASHVYFASQALDTLAALGVPLADALLRFRASFLFGAVAADMTIGKSFAAEEVHCHNWSVAFDLQESAADEAQHAFMWGYLSHLAADTVAHNYFVPHHLVTHADKRSLAHAYWEIRADHLIAEPYWQRLAEVLRVDHRANERLLATNLVPTLFSHRVNRHLFNGMMHVVSRRQWRDAVGRVATRSGWPITPVVLHPYQKVALATTVDLLRNGRTARCVLALDPTGQRALRQAEAVRERVLRGEASDEATGYLPGQLPAYTPMSGGREHVAGHRAPSHGNPSLRQAIEPPSTLTALW
ncbi:MAG: zinc dependent phospholipase C family protein [Nitrospirota bacterium]|jgi:hypothetical protein